MADETIRQITAYLEKGATLEQMLKANEGINQIKFVAFTSTCHADAWPANPIFDAEKCPCPRCRRLKEQPTPDPEAQEARLAPEWENAVNEAEKQFIFIEECYKENVNAICTREGIFANLRSRLAALWPKAGQVPSDEKPIRELVKYLRQLYGNNALPYGEALDNLIAEVERRISHMGQPTKPDAPLTWSEAFADFRGKVRDAISPVYPSNPCSTDDEIIKAIREAVRSSLQPAQPSPVTVEKLAEKIRTIPNPWRGEIDFHQNIRLATRQGFEECREIVLQMLKAFTTLVQGNQPELAEQLQVQLAGCSTAALGNTKNPAKKGDYGWSPAYQDVLELRWKFDALSQERLTREQIEAAVGKFQAKLPTTLAQALKIVGFCQELIDDLMALQPQAQVTREQWERLWPKGYLTSHRPTENDIRAWLKSEFSMEVVDHE